MSTSVDAVELRGSGTGRLVRRAHPGTLLGLCQLCGRLDVRRKERLQRFGQTEPGDRAHEILERARALVFKQFQGTVHSFR